MEYTVRELSDGGEYEFRVAAENKAGLGPFSDTSGTVIAKSPFGTNTTILWQIVDLKMIYIFVEPFIHSVLASP